MSSPMVVPHHGLSSGCDHTPALNLKQDPQNVPPMGEGMAEQNNSLSSTHATCTATGVVGRGLASLHPV